MKLLFLLFSISLPSLLFAQENYLDQTKNKVAQLIHSPAPSDQAWAAYLIGKFQLADFSRELIDILRKPIDDSPDSQILYGSILDALIQNNAEIEGSTLMPFYQKFPHQIILLLAAQPEMNADLLLSLMDRPLTNDQWVALNNLLVRQKNQKIAFRLLNELKIKPEITVTSNPNIFFGSGRGSSGGCGDGFINFSENFPPYVFYKLQLVPLTGASLAINGVHPIYYLRDEVKFRGTKSRLYGSCYENIDLDSFRIEYLAELLHRPVDLIKLQSHPSYRIVWSDLLKYKREVMNFRRELTESFNALKNDLQRRDLLSAEEAEKLALNIEFMIQDKRTDPTIVLPKF